MPSLESVAYHREQLIRKKATVDVEELIKETSAALRGIWDSAVSDVLTEAARYLGINSLEQITLEDVELLSSMLDESLGEGLISSDQHKKMKDLMQASYIKGATEAAAGSGVTLQWGAPDQKSLNTLSLNARYWINSYFDQDVQGGIDGLLKDHFSGGSNRKTVALALKDHFKDRIKKDDNYWDLLADHTMTKTLEIGRVSGYEQAGIDYVQIKVVWDEKTSEICKVMRDRVIPVSSLRGHVDGYLAACDTGDKDKIKKSWPWVRGKQAEKYIKYSTKKIIDQGVVLPPYHGRCRTITVSYFGDVPDGTPSKIEPKPEPKRKPKRKPDEKEQKRKAEEYEKAKKEKIAAKEKADKEKAKAKKEAAKKAAKERAEKEAKDKAKREVEAKKKAEAEAKKKAEAEAKKKAEEKAAKERAAKETKKKAELAAAKKKAEQEAKRKAELAAKKKAEEEAARKAREKAEEKARREAKAKAEKEREAAEKKAIAERKKTEEKIAREKKLAESKAKDNGKKEVESDKYAVYKGNVLDTPEKIRKAILDRGPVFNKKNDDALKRVLREEKKIGELIKKEKNTEKLYALESKQLELFEKRLELKRLVESGSSSVDDYLDILTSGNKQEIKVRHIDDYSIVDKKIRKKINDNVNEVIKKLELIIDIEEQIGELGLIEIFKHCDRAYYTRQGRRIRLHPNDSVDTIAHEIGHHIEYEVNRISEDIEKFFARRIRSKELKPISNTEGEYYRDYGFVNNYTGKTYDDPAAWKGISTEVISMGMTHLFNDGPYKFAQDDPDFFDFIMRTLKRLR